MPLLAYWVIPDLEADAVDELANEDHEV